MGLRNAGGEGPCSAESGAAYDVEHRWEFNPRYLANTSWALATLVVDDSEQREAVRLASIMRV